MNTVLRTLIKIATAPTDGSHSLLLTAAPRQSSRVLLQGIAFSYATLHSPSADCSRLQLITCNRQRRRLVTRANHPSRVWLDFSTSHLHSSSHLESSFIFTASSTTSIKNVTRCCQLSPDLISKLPSTERGVAITSPTGCSRRFSRTTGELHITDSRSNCSCCSSTSLRRNMATQPNEKPPAVPFEGSRDRFGGVTVSSEQETREGDSFESSLAASLSAWRAEGVRGSWFHVDLAQAHWVPVLAKNGFEFHHGEGRIVTMVKWLPTDEPSAIPRYAHTVVGVGALVVREDTDELLVVRERFLKRPHWKLPGGYVEQGEDLAVAAAREVMEETGIGARFVSLVAARHTHAAAFACSDLYFIVLMRPVSTDITMCPLELAACQWMKVEEYRNHPLVHETNRCFVECYLQSRERGISIAATPLYSSVMDKKQVVYAIGFDKPVTGGNNGHCDAATRGGNAAAEGGGCSSTKGVSSGAGVGEAPCPVVGDVSVPGNGAPKDVLPEAQTVSTSESSSPDSASPSKSPKKQRLTQW